MLSRVLTRVVKCFLVEAWMELTFQDGNRMKMEQIARQKWQDGRIVEERFYYNPGPMAGADQGVQ